MMNRFFYSAPKLDTSFASAIGDGVSRAGLGMMQYAKDLEAKKVAQDKIDYERGKAQDTNFAYAQLGAHSYPELAQQFGYDPSKPNTMQDSRFGEAVRAKIELDKGKPALKTIEGSDAFYTLDSQTGEVKNTGIKPYRDPMSGYTSDEKMLGRLYGFGSPEYKKAMENVGAKKQMITTMDDNGNLIYSYPNTTGNPQPVLGVKEKMSPLEQQEKQIAIEKGKVELEEKKQEKKDAVVNMQGSLKSTDQALSQIDSILNHEYLPYATGFLSFTGGINGTPMKDIHAMVDTIKAGAFLSAIENMKGMGALSDAEGKKLSDAIANLDPGQSTEQFVNQLNYIKNSLNNAKSQAIQKLKNRNVQVHGKQNIDDDVEFVKSKLRGK